MAWRTRERSAKIVADVLEGRPRKQVATEHGISLARVHELMVSAGFKDASQRNTDRDRAIIADLDGGRSIKEVAEAAGLSVRRVELIALGRNCQPLPKKKANSQVRDSARSK